MEWFYGHTINVSWRGDVQPHPCTRTAFPNPYVAVVAISSVSCRFHVYAGFAVDCRFKPPPPPAHAKRVKMHVSEYTAHATRIFRLIAATQFIFPTRKPNSMIRYQGTYKFCVRRQYTVPINQIIIYMSQQSYTADTVCDYKYRNQ